MKKNIVNELKKNPILIIMTIISLIISLSAIQISLMSYEAQNLNAEKAMKLEAKIAEQKSIPEKIMILEGLLIDCNNTDNPFTITDDLVRYNFFNISMEFSTAKLLFSQGNYSESLNIIESVSKTLDGCFVKCLAYPGYQSISMLWLTIGVIVVAVIGLFIYLFIPKK